jgi:hypothetical protein
MKSVLTKISAIKRNPNNPRILKDDKFAKLTQSIKDFPQMLDIRPIVVNDDMIVLGGNMRLKACKEAGLKEVPVIKVNDLTEEQQREFIIKDNVGFGEWDLEMLQDWDAGLLDDWGLNLGVDLDSEDFGEDFDLVDGDKEPFTQITFTLADEQAELIKQHLADIKKTDGFKYCETYANENGNGNALYLMVMEWAGLKK